MERYETVHQLVSRIESEIEPGTTLRELFSALFPSGSVTGAPKVRTMELIAGLETSPRGIYTGCIGYLSPGGGSRGPENLGSLGVAAMEACFSVAIRTVCVDRARGQAEYGVGSGVTHYSSAAAEFEECRIKARVLTERRPPFDLFETLRLDAGAGASAAGGRILSPQTATLPGCWIPRPTSGSHATGSGCSPPSKAMPAACAGQEALHPGPAGAFANRTGDGRKPAARSGTRGFVAGRNRPGSGVERRRVPLPQDDQPAGVRGPPVSSCGAEEVLLWNERGELTEASVGNVVVVSEGRRWTPPRKCGLLAGTYRNLLLEAGGDRGAGDSRGRAGKGWEGLFLINSVRGWVPLELAGSGASEEARELELAADMGAG